MSPVRTKHLKIIQSIYDQSNGCQAEQHANPLGAGHFFLENQIGQKDRGYRVKRRYHRRDIQAGELFGQDKKQIAAGVQNPAQQRKPVGG